MLFPIPPRSRQLWRARRATLPVVVDLLLGVVRSDEFDGDSNKLAFLELTKDRKGAVPAELPEEQDWPVIEVLRRNARVSADYGLVVDTCLGCICLREKVGGVADDQSAAIDLDDAKELLRAGADVIAHSVRDRDVDEEFLALIHKKHNGLF